jgi:hypothetical protein
MRRRYRGVRKHVVHITNLTTGGIILIGTLFSYLVAIGFIGLGAFLFLLNEKILDLALVIAGVILTISAFVETREFGHHGAILDSVNWLLPPVGMMIIAVTVGFIGTGFLGTVITVSVGIVEIIDAYLGHQESRKEKAPWYSAIP